MLTVALVLAQQSAQVVPLLGALALLLSSLAGVLGIFLTRAASKRATSGEDLRLLLEERRTDRAEDRAEIAELERDLQAERLRSRVYRRQLEQAGIEPADLSG